MTSRKDVYAAIDSERDYQDMRKTRDQGQEFHSVEEFLLYMEDYLHEARNVASRTWGPDAKPKTLEVLRKVVTLGVACMEIHGAPQRAGYERDPSSTVVQELKVVVDVDDAARRLAESPELAEAIGRMVIEHNPAVKNAVNALDRIKDVLDGPNDRWSRLEEIERIVRGLEGEIEPMAPAPVQVGPLPAGPVEHRPNSEPIEVDWHPPMPGDRMGPDDDEIPF